MLFVDRENLYIGREDIPKLLEDISLGAIGLYLTIKAFEIEEQDGLEESRLLETATDGTEKSKVFLEELIKKDYIQRVHKMCEFYTSLLILIYNPFAF